MQKLSTAYKAIINTVPCQRCNAAVGKKCVTLRSRNEISGYVHTLRQVEYFMLTSDDVPTCLGKFYEPGNKICDTKCNSREDCILLMSEKLSAAHATRPNMRVIGGAMKIAIDFEHTVDLNPNYSHWLKSCPRCSKKAGMVVFKLYPADFGESEARGPGKAGAQSHCLKCRGEK